MYEPTRQDIQEYEEKGYWISPKLIDDDRIARLRHAFDRVIKNDLDGDGSLYDGQYKVPDDPLVMRRVTNAWWVNREIRDMVLDPGLGRICAALMKVDRIRLWAEQTISKPGLGRDGKTHTGNIGWHQDAAYWHINSKRENMITAWIALQDTDLANGGMRTLVRSHKWGFIPDSDKFYDPNLSDQREFFEKKGLGPWIDEPCLLKAGQASFHHPFCFHGSGENRTTEPRLSVIGHYMPDGSAFTPSGKFQVFLRLLGPYPKAGQLFADPAFPLVPK